ncbi:MAG TPA: Ig-like domain-containing protein [Candidatus Eisenbacteria bacterium]|nr:Ig-like domain-containing protein [Candidatus Eisenbacteria bacterium]
MQKRFSKISNNPSMKLKALFLVVFSAVLLLGARLAVAQTESVLYSFTGTPDGQTPTSRLTFHNGNLYGTTHDGGAYGQGSVFQLVPNGSGGWKETTIYSFCPGGAACVDGANPYYAYLTFDSAGNMYGTAFNGGTLGNGLIFELSPSGSGWLQTVLYNFANSPDGANPINGLIMDGSGNLYGTTYAGGAAGGNGSIFEMSKTAGGWIETPLYSISSNGSGLIIDSTGNIFGTSFNNVFKLTSNGQGGYIFSTLFSFNPAKAATQGSNPMGTLAFDSAGRLWGTTEAGGANNDGVVYRLTKGSNGWTQAVMGSFNQTYGTNPTAGLVFDSTGNMFGTTQLGGVYGGGTVYEISPNGKTYTPRIVFRFNGTDGGGIDAPVILDSTGILYGTSYTGGTVGAGTVFAVNPHPSLTTTTVTSSQNPSTFGQAVTFTATVTSTGGTPADGDIVVFEPIGQAPIVNGVATYTYAGLKVGTTKITAVFDGDLNFVKSKSTPLSQVVQP